MRRAVWVAWAAALWTFLAAQPSLFAFAENTLLRACLLGLPVALWSARASLRRHFSFPRPERVLLAVVLVVAAVLRWRAEGLPWHAYDWLEILSERIVREPEPSWYANGFAVFMRIPYLLLGDVESAIFTGNRVAGTLEVLAVWALARVVLEDGGAALAAAAVMAVVPLEIRLSASDSMQVVASLFSTLALAGFAAHAKTGSRALLVAGMLALAYAGLTRPDAMVVAGAVPFYYLARREHARTAFFGWIVVLVVSLPLVVLGAKAMSSKLGGATGLLVHPATALDTWRASLASLGPAHEVLAFGGIAALLLALASRRWALLALVALLAAKIELAGFESNFANRWQLILPQVPVFAIGLGAAGGLVGALLGGWRGMAVGALLAASLVFRPSWNSAPTYDQQQEYRFLRDSKAFPEAAKLGVARPVREAGEGEGAHFQTYRLPAGAGRYSLHDLLHDVPTLPVTYYRGLWCWTPDGLAPSCREVEERFVLEELDSAPLDAPTFVGPGHPANARIGLYRVVARR